MRRRLPQTFTTTDMDKDHVGETKLCAHFSPVGVAILRSFSAVAIARADRPASSVRTQLLSAFFGLVAILYALGVQSASLTPCAFLAASREIMALFLAE
jgi:hypothetical protein